MGDLKGKIKVLILKLFISIVFYGIFSVLIFILFSQILHIKGIITSRYLASNFDKNNNIISEIKKQNFDYSLYKNNICIENTISNKLDIYVKQALKDKDTVKTYEADYKYILLNTNEELILRLPNQPEFVNKKLREKFSFNNLSYIFIAVLFFTLSFIKITIFSIKLNREFKKIENLTKIIDKNCLDIPNINSKIYEFNNIINSIKHISNELKHFLNEEINQKNIQKFQMACLSHDIKTPLTIIKGNAELLQLDLTEEEQKECINFIIKSSDTIENYIDLIIQYYKLNSSLGILFNKINLKELIETINLEILAYLKNSNVIFKIKNNTNLNEFDGNFIHIKRSLINLINNAYEYSKKDKFTILLNIEEIENNIYFSVNSSGSIFSDYILENGGNIFFKDDKGRDDKHYGLGLSYVNEVCKQHNGKFNLKNENNISVVILSFPIFQKINDK